MPTYNPTDSRYLTVSQVRTNNGQKDVKIILDVITNEFYTLDDDGNFILIGGTLTFEDVLNQGSSTGDIIIISPDNLTELGIIDGEGYILCLDGDFETSINVKGTGVSMVYDDTPGGINNEVKIDAVGYFFKDLFPYADDDAATTDGLPQGYLYQTDGSGAAPLNVPGIVMIKQ
jgi:hypothetical protein